MSFISSLHKGGILFDGGFGAILIRKEIATPECIERMNLIMPEIVRDIHKEFVSAGSNAVETNTFGANPVSLAKHGLAKDCAQINAAAVSLAREAVGDEGFVALSMGPSGGLLKPLGELGAQALLDSYFLQAKVGMEAGADAVIIETMGDIAEARLAAIAALEARAHKEITVVASFTFQGERLMTGGTPESAALILEAAGVDALGVNCSGGPDQLESVVRRMRAVTVLPVIVQPNAGIPHMEGGKTIFPLAPQEMAEKMGKIIAAGAQAIGGCCGTTPEHIRLMKPYIEQIGVFVPPPKKMTAAVTARNIFPIGGIGVNFQALEPTVDGLYDADPDAAAVSLDVSGLSLEETEELMLEAQQMLKTPLCVDADDERKLEYALKMYSGVALTHGKSFYGAVRI